MWAKRVCAEGRAAKKIVPNIVFQRPDVEPLRCELLFAAALAAPSP